MTKHLVFFIADGFQPLDLFGPLDTYLETNSIVPNAYQAVLMGLQAGPVKSASGAVVMAEVGLADTLAIDYLIICGGSGMRQLALKSEQQQKLRTLADKADKVLSICTGAFILAKLYQDRSFTLTICLWIKLLLSQVLPVTTVS
ncbi:DJ-1/PfpI family protein [Rheinheimera soli]|uniref:DJ-1/PfpI family protein n=1 Tax=Rheinheimera soli TaxID=443616 RepID=UPI001E610E8B|nr:DJ-1/PfpI family protein [Rheinheimera soli]